MSSPSKRGFYKHLFKHRGKWHINTGYWEYARWVDDVTDVILLNVDEPYYQHKNGKLLLKKKPVDPADLTFFLLKVEEFVN